MNATEAFVFRVPMPLDVYRHAIEMQNLEVYQGEI